MSSPLGPARKNIGITVETATTSAQQ
uniref:Uncharacterized protein n=1 Tax=Rhizophora mucronata TaxID=61149 RepID=A0A2P2Q7U3_RHIMU